MCFICNNGDYGLHFSKDEILHSADKFEPRGGFCVFEPTKHDKNKILYTTQTYCRETVSGVMYRSREQMIYIPESVHLLIWHKNEDLTDVINQYPHLKKKFKDFIYIGTSHNQLYYNNNGNPYRKFEFIKRPNIRHQYHDKNFLKKYMYNYEKCFCGLFKNLPIVKASGYRAMDSWNLLCIEMYMNGSDSHWKSSLDAKEYIDNNFDSFRVKAESKYSPLNTCSGIKRAATIMG